MRRAKGSRSDQSAYQRKQVKRAERRRQHADKYAAKVKREERVDERR